MNTRLTEIKCGWDRNLRETQALLDWAIQDQQKDHNMMKG